MIWRLRWWLIRWLAWGRPVVMNIEYAGYMTPMDYIDGAWFWWNARQIPFREQRAREPGIPKEWFEINRPS